MVAAVVLVCLALPHWPRHLDDLDITVAYSYAWRDHGVLAWTSGEIVEGYSNFLWLMLAEAVVQLRLDPIGSLKVASLLGGASLLTTLSWRAPWDLRGHVIVAAFALWAPLAYWSALGFETTTFALLVATGWLFTLRGRRNRASGLERAGSSRGTRAPCVAGLMSVVRDGRPELGRTEDRLVGVSLVALGLYHLSRVAVCRCVRCARPARSQTA